MKASGAQRRDWATAVRWSILAAAIGAFLWFVSLFYLPDRGFTSFLTLGEREHSHYLPELRAMDVVVLPDSHGYDAQYYAQLAMRPNLRDPALASAIDNLPYRARRMLLSWTAWLLGGGDAERALHVYAVQNVVAWLLLAVVLLHWFPPSSASHLVRWLGVMASLGLWSSVRHALVDGPSLLLIALGLLALERNRRWGAAAIFGLAGLARETNLLAAVALLPRERTARAWGAALAQALIVAGPLALWIAWVTHAVGTGSGSTAANFAFPFIGYAQEWRESLAHTRLPLGFAESWAGLAVIIGLTVQLLFFALRPRVSDPWWRLGAMYLVLMTVLGPAVWEGIPGAACRVLLPLTLAFNLLVPRGRWWWPVLLLGNVSVIPTVLTIPPAIGEVVAVVDHGEESRAAPSDGRVEVRFGEGWYPMEQSRYGGERWRWASGSAGVTIFNPAAVARRARLEFEIAGRGARTVRVQLGEQALWEDAIAARAAAVFLPDVILPPGATELTFVVDRPGTAGDGDSRLLAFMLKDARLVVLGDADE